MATGRVILVSLSERNAKISETAYTSCSLTSKFHGISAASIKPILFTDNIHFPKQILAVLTGLQLTSTSYGKDRMLRGFCRRWHHRHRIWHNSLRYPHRPGVPCEMGPLAELRISQESELTEMKKTQEASLAEVKKAQSGQL